MHFNRLALPLVLAVLAGCSSTKLAEPVAPAPVATAAPVPAAKPATPAQPAQTTVKTVAVHPLDDPKSSLAKRSVYFDFDSFLISSADRPLIESHAKYLVSSRTAKVRIEGNADERGGREYNLALGQRRAEAVLKSLTLLGAPAIELEATSFGKERPVDTGHDETAWAKNRRADLNYVRR
jgi:peptidoglycan-associated lipoprotein